AMTWPQETSESFVALVLGTLREMLLYKDKLDVTLLSYIAIAGGGERL
ncbi:MAG: hypothetical protein ACJAVO_001701, partial [Parvibaculaceae bacterium]